jgi:metal-responsive CopG/Arc/MetJ family transcriptional regulator
MKEKTSITLSREVLRGIDRLAGSKLSRSALIDDVLAQYLRDTARAQIEARDIALLNQAADELGDEIEEVLRDQGEVV